ncbi:MAG: 30S ribosomal protein S9 [Planctomycetota bacterium]
MAPPKGLIHHGTGRRKSSVARVRILPGDGKVTVNKRGLEQYFHLIQDRNVVLAPLEATESNRAWNVMINVNGGGTSGQAGAIRLGLARALISANENFEATLRDAGYLTRDARRVERKKPGRRKARRSFQFSKR